MGYELHVTRAFVTFDSPRYPILDAEVVDVLRDLPDLVIPPDAPRRPGFAYVDWAADTRERPHYLLFRDGLLSTKHPEDPFILRMIDMAARLDAWVIGDDGEVYSRDGDRVVSWQRGPAAFAWQRSFITRGGTYSGMNQATPILPAEWADLTAGQSDFETMTRIAATLPSGERLIECPPVTCWTGHPAGRPIPFYFDEDLIEVRFADTHTEQRMIPLADALGARVLPD